MIRLSLIAALAGLLLCGCGQSEVTVSDGTGAAGQAKPGEAPAGDQEVKTPLIRALLQTVDEAKGESPEAKESLKRTLREADRELAEVLGGKSKQLILAANKKPPMPVVGAPAGPPPKTEPGKAADPEKTGPRAPKEAGPDKPPATAPEPGPATPAAPDDDQELKNPMVRALIQAVDETEGEQDEAKQELKRLLRQVDKDLSEVLGANSKRLIQEANKKAPAPVVGTDGSGEGNDGGPEGVKVRSLKGVKVLEFKRPGPEK